MPRTLFGDEPPEHVPLCRRLLTLLLIPRRESMCALYIDVRMLYDVRCNLRRVPTLILADRRAMGGRVCQCMTRTDERRRTIATRGIIAHLFIWDANWSRDFACVCVCVYPIAHRVHRVLNVYLYNTHAHC